MKNLLPTIRGLNAWSIKQSIKDATVQRASTIRLMHSLDVYRMTQHDRDEILNFKKSAEAADFIKTYGVLNRTTGVRPSHSFVLQFLQIFESDCAHADGGVADSVSVLDTSNTARALYATTTASYYHWSVEAPATNTSYGILLGTGVTAPVTANYTMETLIAHGSGGGQLQYGVTGVGAAAAVGANVDMVIVRPFVNGSGGDITPREMGLTVYHTIGASASRFYFLVAHDAVNQAIANGEVAIASYVMRTTV